MYIPEYFKNKDLEEVKDFLQQNSFGILITNKDNKSWGTHIPLELEKDALGKEVLYGHISKANPQWKHFKEAGEILAIFSGPHAYVSSSWYNQENVPTWNYIAVHIYGELVVLEEEELLFSIKKLVNKYEANSANPVKVEEMSESTLRQLKGIIGFKIHIKEIQAAYKLSQNRDTEDYHNITKELDKTEDILSQRTSKIMKQKRGL